MAGIEDISGMMVGNYKIRDKYVVHNSLYLQIKKDQQNNYNCKLVVESRDQSCILPLRR